MPTPTRLLCKLHKNSQRLQLGRKPRHKHASLVHIHCVADQGHQLLCCFHAECRETQILLEVPMVVECQMIHMNACALWIVHILTERVHQDIQLSAKCKHCNILELKLLKKRHACTNVTNIIHTKNVDA